MSTFRVLHLNFVLELSISKPVSIYHACWHNLYIIMGIKKKEQNTGMVDVGALSIYSVVFLKHINRQLVLMYFLFLQLLNVCSYVVCCFHMHVCIRPRVGQYYCESMITSTKENFQYQSTAIMISSSISHCKAYTLKTKFVDMI